MTNERLVNRRILAAPSSLTGKKGVITTVVTISVSGGDKGWTIKSGSDSYKGIQGKGRETGGASLVVSFRLNHLLSGSWLGRFGA
jgi:hypothetical protein